LSKLQQQIHDKSTTNRISGVWALLYYRRTTSDHVQACHCNSSYQQRVSTIWDACIRYGTVSVETSWRSSSYHWSSRVLTTVIPCSPAYLHPRWRLYNVYRTRLLDWCLISTGSRMYHFSTTALALATRPVPHYLQDCNADAPNPPQSLSVVSHRPGRVQHGGLTTTSAQVVTNQKDPLRQTRLLCLRTSYMEQSSSSGLQHWQLSSVQTSSQVTSVSSCFYRLTFILFSIPTHISPIDYCNAQSALFVWLGTNNTFFIIIINNCKQEPQLSQRSRVTPSVVQNFAVTQGDSRSFDFTPSCRPFVSSYYRFWDIQRE